jgi:hypothetical protein
MSAESKLAVFLRVWSKEGGNLGKQGGMYTLIASKAE